MSEFEILYVLDEAGWAEVTFKNDADSVSREVSYLHDSLLDLANMAIDLKAGEKSGTSVFMDEPGEYQFVVSVTGSIASYEFRQYKDWASWNMWPKDDYKLILSGETTVNLIVSQITNIMWQIHQNIGPEKYKELWVEHGFPVEQFRRLANA